MKNCIIGFLAVVLATVGLLFGFKSTRNAIFGRLITIPTPINGKDGKDGINGVDGINGTNGQDGRDGVDGINGISQQEAAFLREQVLTLKEQNAMLSSEIDKSNAIFEIMYSRGIVVKNYETINVAMVHSSPTAAYTPTVDYDLYRLFKVNLNGRPFQLTCTYRLASNTNIAIDILFQPTDEWTVLNDLITENGLSFIMYKYVGNVLSIKCEFEKYGEGGASAATSFTFSGLITIPMEYLI
jgi:hypothetical protein